ncbi:hypothetical protein JYU34_011053 [Plutella xylostella]|uniref:Secreted protein n=1 Tax=Plutella xylostella TaxID=51655 RepID=A0ABQ7QFY1_PLUXY|nr:hypothetical protein JYU34_011053 [Plutella xylostella]
MRCGFLVFITSITQSHVGSIAVTRAGGGWAGGALRHTWRLQLLANTPRCIRDCSSCCLKVTNEPNEAEIPWRASTNLNRL